MKSKLNFLLLILITVIVLYVSLKDDCALIINEILKMNPFCLLMGFIFLGVYYLFKSISMLQIVKTFNCGYTLKKSLMLTLKTNFFHAVTPFSSGGQPYEIYSLKKENISLANATSISIQSFIVYQIALVLLGIIAVLINFKFNLFVSSGVLNHLVTLGFLINTAVVIFLFLLSLNKKINKIIVNFVIEVLYRLKLIKDKRGQIKKWNESLNELSKGTVYLLKDKKKFVKLFFFQFLGLIFLYSVPLMVVYATGNYQSINILDSIVSTAYVMLVGSFVPIPGGTGGLEYGFVSFFGNFINGNLLKAVMLVWRFITYYFGMILGAILLGFGRKD